MARSEVHPLLIEHVAEEVMRGLSVSDLKNCRLVCRLWDEISFKGMRKEVCLEFKLEEKSKVHSESEAEESEEPAEELEDENSSDCESEGSSSTVEELPETSPEFSKMPEYMEYLQTNPGFVFSKVLFREVSLKAPLSQKFLTEFGQTLQQLELHLNSSRWFGWFAGEPHEVPQDVPLVTPEVFREMLATQCPELKKLSLFCVPQALSYNSFRLPADTFATKIEVLNIFDNLRWLDIEPDFLRDLLASCPGLKTLVFKADFHALYFFVVDLLGESLCCETLKELSLDRVDETCIKALSRSQAIRDNLKLRKLEFCDLFLRGAETEFTAFLESQAETLEELLLYDWHGYRSEMEEYLIKFPIIPRLTKLRVGTSKNPSTRNAQQIIFAPFDFKLTFPALRTLILNGRSDFCDVDSFLGTESAVHPGVVSLELLNNLTVEQMATAGRLFPNVRELVAGTQSDKSLQQIWTMWINLESLFLCINIDSLKDFHREECVNVDFLFTGLSPKETKEHKGSLSELFALGHPSIRNLTNLRRLAVHSGVETKRFDGLQPDALTDFSFTHAFSCLSKLEYIRIESFKIVDKKAVSEAMNSLGLREQLDAGESLQFQKIQSFVPHHREDN